MANEIMMEFVSMILIRPNEVILKAMSKTPDAITFACPRLSMFALIIGAINM